MAHEYFEPLGATQRWQYIGWAVPPFAPAKWTSWRIAEKIHKNGTTGVLVVTCEIWSWIYFDAEDNVDSYNKRFRGWALSQKTHLFFKESAKILYSPVRQHLHHISFKSICYMYITWEIEDPSLIHHFLGKPWKTHGFQIQILHHFTVGYYFYEKHVLTFDQHATNTWLSPRAFCLLAWLLSTIYESM